ncbi:MAG: elongation factor P [Candidatus Latescibacterota bacterium]|nr:MAG: elongation factor P [Candidatus Latescibacterota bacterium]
MASTADFRNGMVLKHKADYWSIVEFQHVKPGKGGAFVRTKLKRLRTGQVVEETFRAGEKFPDVRAERRSYQFLYSSGDEHHFMNMETYEQLALDEAVIGDARLFLSDNQQVELLSIEDKPISIEVPAHVELRVTETEPGVRGDTATGAQKPATLETGLVVQVPLFIEVGEVLRVDTRTRKYLERVS